MCVCARMCVCVFWEEILIIGILFNSNQKTAKLILPVVINLHSDHGLLWRRNLSYAGSEFLDLSSLALCPAILPWLHTIMHRLMFHIFSFRDSEKDTNILMVKLFTQSHQLCLLLSAMRKLPEYEIKYEKFFSQLFIYAFIPQIIIECHIL